jgi:hypothetical protein
LRPRQFSPICQLPQEEIVDVSAPGLISTYLLVRLLAGATLTLVIVAAIACPLVWSRDAARRARAGQALRLLIFLLTGRVR